MPEKVPPPGTNPENKKGTMPELPKFEATTEEGKKIEGEILLSEQQVAEYLADHESMQREMLGGKEHLVLRGMSVKRARELMGAMGTRGLTIEELAEAMAHDAGFAQRVKEKVKALIAPMGEATSKNKNLNWQVSDAIREAELLEDANNPKAKEVFLKVSQLEEQLASLLPVSGVEGALARRGAVRAAVK